MTALERKQQTEELLLSEGIPVFDGLPPMEEEEDVQTRTAQEVAQRIIVLTYLSCVATQEGLRQQLTDSLKEQGLWQVVSPQEKILFEKTTFTEEEIDAIIWRGESIWLLLWSINKVDKMGLPRGEADIVEVIKYLPAFVDSAEFINDATIRPVSEILDEADLIFRISWAMNKSEPDVAEQLNLSPGVVYERYFAINWITYVRDEWDIEES